MAETKNETGGKEGRADTNEPPLGGGGGGMVPPEGTKLEPWPTGGTSRISAVESAKMRARIESTPGGARYEEQAKQEAEKQGKQYTPPAPGKGRDEPLPEREGTKKYRVETEDKWYFDNQGPLKKGDILHLNEDQAKRAGKNVRAA